MQYFLLVLREYKSAEAHPVQVIHIKFLVRLMMGFRTPFTFQSRPTVFIEHRQVGEPLQISSVILQDDTARKHALKFFDQFGLEIRLLQI